MEQDFDLFPEFNDAECIKFIKGYIPEQDLEGVSEEDIQFVLDSIYDFYEEEGLIDEDDATEAIIDEDKELQYVLNSCREEGKQITEEQIKLILTAEYEFGVELGIYDEVDE